MLSRVSLSSGTFQHFPALCLARLVFSTIYVVDVHRRIFNRRVDTTQQYHGKSFRFIDSIDWCMLDVALVL